MVFSIPLLSHLESDYLDFCYDLSRYSRVFQKGGDFMGLVKCKDCGAQVSDSATKCPQCGHDLRMSGAGCGFFFFACFLTAVAGIVATNGGSVFWFVPAVAMFALSIWLVMNEPSKTE